MTTTEGPITPMTTMTAQLTTSSDGTERLTIRGKFFDSREYDTVATDLFIENYEPEVDAPWRTRSFHVDDARVRLRRNLRQVHGMTAETVERAVQAAADEQGFPVTPGSPTSPTSYHQGGHPEYLSTQTTLSSYDALFDITALLPRIVARLADAGVTLTVTATS